MTRLLTSLLIVVLVVAALVVRHRHDRHPAANLTPPGSRPVVSDFRVLSSLTARVRVAAHRGGSAGRRGSHPRLHWDALAQCESSGHWDDNTGNGYYGAYQFDLSTWRGVGGVGLPSDASPREQGYRARLLYADRGSQPWPTCGYLLGGAR